MQELIIAIAFTLIIGISYSINSHYFSSKKVPIGYFDKDFHFHHTTISVANRLHDKINIPLYMWPYKDSNLFYVDIGYSVDINADETFIPLEIESSTRKIISNGSSCRPSGYLLFTTSYPGYDPAYYIVKTSDSIVLVSHYELNKLSGKIKAYSVSSTLFSQNHFHELGALSS